MELEKLVRPNILTLEPYSSARTEFKGLAEVFLDANENPFETGLNRYPDPLQWSLKKKISDLKGVPIEHIFLGNGSDEVIDLLIRIFCEPKEDHILLLPPTYGMYKVSARIADVGIRNVSLTQDFQPDVKNILETANANSKLLFLCSPNNPTGNAFEANRIATLASEFKGIVVVDEAYIDFSEAPSSIHLLKKYPNLVVMQTFSKAWGLAGVRLGMAFAGEPIIHLLNKVKPPYNINQLTQTAVSEALDQENQKNNWVRRLLEERFFLEKALVELPFVQKIYPSDANFLLVKMDDPIAIYHHLIGEKVIIRNRSTVHLCEGCLRITVGRKEENQQLLSALNQYTSIAQQISDLKS